ncbi:MAG TPA: hypothetical protein DD379_04725 [Cyanobacteria bacterium UBA11162]|nr:hypothetical protein [Cyanobacteria bacterium UBA11162]
MRAVNQNRTRQPSTNLPVPNNKGVTSGLGRSLNQFVQSLGEVLIDITALEVNTMVVEHISGDKFIAWETYRDIYPISPGYLEQQGIHESLRDRYLDLRRNLEREYRSLLSDPNSEFYDPSFLETATDDQSIALRETRLPNPLKPNSSDEILKAQKVLHNCRFLRCLRKMCELKAVLDSRNTTLWRQQLQQPNSSDTIQKTVIHDTIYAQTIVQLDGDVINRYAQEILTHPHRDVILDIHREGVSASENQWRGLLDFIIGLVQAVLQRGS